ncbi:MAG: hypothetical protein WCX69_02095 [Candidatus Paceibacterota bacterium]
MAKNEVEISPVENAAQIAAFMGAEMPEDVQKHVNSRLKQVCFNGHIADYSNGFTSGEWKVSLSNIGGNVIVCDIGFGQNWVRIYPQTGGVYNACRKSAKGEKTEIPRHQRFDGGKIIDL